MPGGPYRIVSVGQALGIGLEGSHEVTLHAVAKRNSDDSPYCVANELICGEIGRLLRLPVPPCGVIYAPDVEPPYWFASLDFNLVGDALPNVVPGECVRQLPNLSAGIVVFDLLIGNPDRHTGNIAMDATTKPPRLNLFDHGMALLGAIEGEAAKRLPAQQDSFIIGRHCLLRHLPNDRHIGEWVSRVRQIPDYFIDSVCDDTIGLGVNKEEARAAAAFLKHRRDTIQSLVKGNQAAFTSIKGWSLFS